MSRILHLQQYLNISCGISKTIYSIIKNSDDTKKNNKFFVATLGGDGIERFTKIGINPLVLKFNFKNVFHFPFLLFQILKICKNHDIEIIHSHHRYFDLIAFAVSKIIKVKTVTSVQSIVKGRKSISYKADKLIACSNAVKNHLINYFKINENRIKVINNFVNPDEKKLWIQNPELKIQLGINSNQIIIGYIGRLDLHEKGIDILIEAIKQIYKDNLNIVLLLIGNGKDEIIIRDLLNRTKINSMIISPKINISDYYKIINVFVLPSRIDPFPLVMLEAGLHEKIFIGASVDGIAELIQDGYDGLLFESENYKELSKKIMSVLSNYKDALIMGKNLNRKIMMHYTAEIGVAKYKKVYEELMYNV